MRARLTNAWSMRNPFPPFGEYHVYARSSPRTCRKASRQPARSRPSIQPASRRLNAGHLLVDDRAPGVRVAQHQRRALAPPLGHGEDGVEKVPLPSGDPVGHVHGADGERQGRRHRGEEPAPGLARRPAPPHGAERPPRGQQEAVGARRRRVAGGELVDEAEIGEGSPQGRRWAACPLNSESATTSGRQRSSWAARASPRRPPPARMFHPTMRTAGVYSTFPGPRNGLDCVRSETLPRASRDLRRSLAWPGCCAALTAPAGALITRQMLATGGTDDAAARVLHGDRSHARPVGAHVRPPARRHGRQGDPGRRARGRRRRLSPPRLRLAEPPPEQALDVPRPQVAAGRGDSRSGSSPGPTSWSRTSAPT